MKTIIIDGYNAIYRIPEFSLKLKESLTSARKALARHLSDWRRKYSNAEVYVVFDSGNADEFSYPRVSLYGVDCFFTQAQDGADGHIISMVRDSEEPGSIVVVSDDNYIRNSCKVHGAKVENTTFLLKRKTN